MENSLDSKVPFKEDAEKKSDAIPAVETTDDGFVYVLDARVPMSEKGGELVPALESFRHFTHDRTTLETMKKVATAAEMQMPCLLEGETAASKTSSIEYLAALTNNEVHRLNLNGQSDTSELVGKFVPNDGQLQIEFEEALRNPHLLQNESKQIVENANSQGRALSQLECQKIAAIEGIKVSEWRWQDGIIPLAMKKGGWVILDEINLAEPQNLERLISVLEKSPNLTLSENGGVKIGQGGKYPVNEAFRIFATMNPAEYAGRQAMSPAYKDRWQAYKFVETPGKTEYHQMLELIAFGTQPEVNVNGENYSAEDTEPLYPKISQVSNMRLFLPVLAQFHDDLVNMAKKQEIGRDSKEGLIFTRRGLLSFMQYLSVKEIVDRRARRVVGVMEDPKRIILEAIREFYLDKAKSFDDKAKITDLLASLRLTADNFCVDFTSESTIKTETAQKVGETMETSESSQEVQAELERISEGQYLSPKKIDQLLRGLKGANCSLPASEISRMESELPRRLSPETKARLEKLKNATEDNVAPLIQQIPRKFMVNGVEKDFTIAAFKEVWDKARQNDGDMHNMWLSDYVTEESKTKVFDGSLRAYTPKCLKDSKSKDYESQLKHQKTVMGEGSEVDERMYIAMLFKYLASGKKERLMSSDYMRLNARATDGDPLRVDSNVDDLDLRGSRRAALSRCGLGASLGISS